MTKFAEFSHRKPLTTALALALGSAISLGLARFSYALFLPLMREDLGWSYLIAGMMNTANAAGYFIGAILAPWCFRRASIGKVFIAGAFLTSLLLGFSGLVTGTLALFLLRFLAGVGSALVFVGGGALAAQLGSLHPGRSGFLLGIYYGGTGFGIILSSILVPLTASWAIQQNYLHAWQSAWCVLSVTALTLSFLIIRPSLSVPVFVSKTASGSTTQVSRYLYIVVAYCCFGMGYIGYMTFVIALLKQIGLAGSTLNIFYAVLGLFVMASSRIWAPILDRYKGGQSLAIFNTLLGIASFIPAIIALTQNQKLITTGILGTASTAPTLGNFSIMAIFVSGMVFGACFVSAVAATTSFVKHNLPQAQWVSGITVFTVIFAMGQVLGPTIVGWISDGSGGLARGLLLSGFLLLTGAVLAWRQKPLK